MDIYFILPVAIFVLVVLIIFVFRPLLTWLHSINDVIKNQKQSNQFLEEIVDILKYNMKVKEKPATWVCANCQTVNSIDLVYCEKCKAEI
jgi:cell division protein FtsL